MKEITNSSSWDEAKKDFSSEMGYSYIRDRLHKIEEILGENYDLEELSEIFEAKKNGKLVILPCKRYDEVWFIKSDFSNAVFPIKAIIWSIKGIDCDGDVIYAAQVQYNLLERTFKGSDIGKTVFLSEKEATEKIKSITGKAYWMFDDNDEYGKTFKCSRCGVSIMIRHDHLPDKTITEIKECPKCHSEIVWIGK